MIAIHVVRRNPALVLISAVLLLLAACNPFGSDGGGGGGTLTRAEGIIATATARASVPVPTPTPTVTPAPTPTLLPTATPTPMPTVSQAMAESLVWSALSGCAEQVATPPEEAEAGTATTAEAVEVNVVFSTTYDPANFRWVVDVTTNDDLLSFGQWRVVDGPPSAAPQDATAARIATGDVRCALPRAFLKDAPTPPLFLPAPPPAPTPTPTIALLVSTAELAATQVWTSVYGCFQEFPSFESFAGRPGLEGNWIVEGKSGTSQYGLWEVDAVTGEPSPRDDLARQVSESCATEVQPAVVTSEEASIRAWVAAYDCFSPRPTFDAFTTRQEDPRQWIVEGRGTVEVEVEVTVDTGSGTETFTETRTQTAFYGLWLVDTETGRVRGLDNVARAQAVNTCFKELP